MLILLDGIRLSYYSKEWWQKCTFWGLMAATGGDPGGPCVDTFVLNVWFAICMHSSRVLRKVVHVDFTMFPESIPVWKGHTNIHISSHHPNYPYSYALCLVTVWQQDLHNSIIQRNKMYFLSWPLVRISTQQRNVLLVADIIYII